MVMRIKKGLENPNDLGGHGGDQCYFEGNSSLIEHNLFPQGPVAKSLLNPLDCPGRALSEVKFTCGFIVDPQIKKYG